MNWRVFMCYENACSYYKNLYKMDGMIKANASTIQSVTLQVWVSGMLR